MPVVIEWLEFRVAPEERQYFLEADAEIWTALLAQCDGFLGKEVWLDSEAGDRLALVIRWQTRAQWAAVSEATLAAAEAHFAERCQASYTLLAAREYQVQAGPT